MALIVEDGTGKADADSYLSVADANTYHTAHSASSTWSAAEDTDKEKALRLATQYLDVEYSGRWRGSRASGSQALSWPRFDAVDLDGYVISSTSVPQAVKDAVAEAALRVLNGDTLLDDLSNDGDIKSTRVVVGPIEKAVEYVGANSPSKAYPLIDGILRSLVQASGELRRA